MLPCCGAVGGKQPRRQIDELGAMLDLDGDGQVTFQELLETIKEAFQAREHASSSTGSRKKGGGCPTSSQTVPVACLHEGRAGLPLALPSSMRCPPSTGA